MKIKLVFVGPSNAGKTSIINRFVYNEFSVHILPSTQPAFCQKVIKVNNQNIQLEIWDTAGQERYHSLSPLFYRDADIGIVTFDLTSTDSFETARQWIDELHQNRGDGIIIGLAGNKRDLADQRQISFAQMHKFAQDTNVVAVETSAQSGENINYMFDVLLKQFIDSGNTPSKGNDTPVPDEKSGCFC
ncbi:small GTP-binding protein, putative [Trichomonas vaginalis G3]|uniref:Small GTP-binding protein, putative n=1 Tax=Trichomonas vaginalis (strain ATCC PRA-98 / G3) TaxID=412133 RepID=A2FYF0_TRIV3|nr:GTPase protein [Trichomonas vaginalis G3]EAX90067.1 small GTP-binding protein, putative [Trichomonas vaginalis G3]KAI5515519.1 GTPase protein [Trichomonas vaginalis G3]|eukprot:XP_001302997.1 small GTP-binding protein [Trichomonas vaginalis G3]